MSSLGEETGVGHGVEGVKVISIMAETDLKRRVLKLNLYIDTYIYIYIYTHICTYIYIVK
jgi:hypothetical protein